MIINEVIKGMEILSKYFDEDGYNVGAEHDVIYVYNTDKAVSEEDIVTLRSNGWEQDSAEYSLKESWQRYL